MLTLCILLAAMLRCRHLFWSRLLLNFHYFRLLKRIEHFTFIKMWLADVQLELMLLYVKQTFINHHQLLLLNVYSVVVFAVNLPSVRDRSTRFDTVYYSLVTSVFICNFTQLVMGRCAQHYSLFGDKTTRILK